MKLATKIAIGFSFFISGLTSLVLEIVWNKQLSYIFGISLHSTAVVVAAYMFGLALGAWGISRVKGKINRPIQIYAYLQICIGLFGTASISIFRFLQPAFIFLKTTLAFSSSLFFLAQFLILFLTLALPVTLMGATLPLITSAFDQTSKKTAVYAGIMYGINTLGAVCGCLVGGFVLLPQLGLTKSAITAGSIDFSLGCILILFRKSFVDLRGGVADKKVKLIETSHKNKISFVLCLFGISGFFAMIYEVAWFRFLSNIFGATVHAFSMMLAVFLIGISLGSLVSAKFVRKSKNALFNFASFELLLGLVTLLTLSLYNFVPIWYGRLFESLGLFPAQFLVSGFVVLPATLCMGALFAMVVSLVSESSKQETQREVGRAYSVNTLGNILGSIAAGFVIVPKLGYANAIMLACVGSILLGLVVVTQSTLEKPRKIKMIFGSVVLSIVLMILIPSPDLLLLNQGIAMVMRNQQKFEDVVAGKQNEFQTLLFHRDGINESIAVIGNEANDGSLGFRVSSKNEASTSLLGRRHLLLLGELPLLFSRHQEQVAILGLGAGFTAGAVLNHSDVKHVDILELEPSVVEALKYFDVVNGKPLSDSRVFLHTEDGRVFLNYTQKKYDVITTDPVSPWLAGSSNLYSTDFYKIMSQRLSPGGIFCQWIQMGDFSENVYKIILSSLHHAFSYVAIFVSTYDTVVLASNEPIKISWEEFQKRFNAPDVKAIFENDEINSAAEVLSFYFAGTEQIERYLNQFAHVNTDDNIWMETHLPYELYSYYGGNFGAGVLRALTPGRFNSLFKMVSGFPVDEVSVALRENSPDEFPMIDEAVRSDILGVLENRGYNQLAEKIKNTKSIQERETDARESYIKLLSSADILIANNDLNNASQIFSEILKFKKLKGFYPYGIKFINLLISKGKLDDALRVTDLLEKNMPAFAAAYVYEIKILRQLGRNQDALIAKQKGLFLNPDNTELQSL